MLSRVSINKELAKVKRHRVGPQSVSSRRAAPTQKRKRGTRTSTPAHAAGDASNPTNEPLITALRATTALVEAIGQRTDEFRETVEGSAEHLLGAPFWGRGGIADRSGRFYELFWQSHAIFLLQEELRKQLDDLLACATGRDINAELGSTSSRDAALGAT